MNTFGPIDLYFPPSLILFQFVCILKAINTFFSSMPSYLQKGLNYVYAFCLSLEPEGCSAKTPQLQT